MRKIALICMSLACGGISQEEMTEEGLCQIKGDPEKFDCSELESRLEMARTEKGDPTDTGYIPDGFGSYLDGAATRCSGRDWPFYCHVPIDKYFSVHNSVPTSDATWGSTLHSGVTSGINRACLTLLANDVHCELNPSSSGADIVVSATTTGTYAGLNTPTSSGVFEWDNAGRGTIHYDETWTVKIQKNNIWNAVKSIAFSKYGRLPTNTEKSNYVSNIVYHEIMHSAGLGHKNDTPCYIMKAEACPDYIVTTFTLDTRDQDMLEFYIP